MRIVSNSKYEAPRAVRLSGLGTASAKCVNRHKDAADECGGGFSVQQSACGTDPDVQFWPEARKRVLLPESRLVAKEG